MSDYNQVDWPQFDDDFNPPHLDPEDSKELLNEMDKGVAGSERPVVEKVVEPREPWDYGDNAAEDPEQAWA